MAGGLLQIIAYGAHDIFLTNDPHITYFKIMYRRHTNFSIQTFERTFNDNPDFGLISKTKLFKLGDLVTKMYLKIVIGEIKTDKNIKIAWIRRLGHAIIKMVEITIGGMKIDRQYGTWLDIWYELSRKGDHERGYSKMIGDISELTDYNDISKPSYTLYVPLQFWFNRYYGLALPLIALQYHDVFINVEYEDLEKLLVRSKNFKNFKDIKILEVGLISDYIFLDIDERRKFAISGHEYLIDVVQYAGDISMNESIKKISLDFNFPTKELIWAMKNGRYNSNKSFLCYCNNDNWDELFYECSKDLLNDSMILSKSKDLPDKVGKWEVFTPNTFNSESDKKNLIINNNSQETYLWINSESLKHDDYSLIDKIEAIISLSENNDILIDIIKPLNETEISIPIEDMIDTRIKSTDVIINQFSNYSPYLTGRGNPVLYGMLEYNDSERIEKRDSTFFGILQPYLHHSNTPADGINLYSFALEPEKHQPTGTSNFTKIENIFLTLWFSKNKDIKLNNFNLDNRLFIYAFSYNIIRIMNGLAALVY